MMESLARLLEVDVRFRMERSLTMVVGLSGRGTLLRRDKESSLDRR